MSDVSSSNLGGILSDIENLSWKLSVYLENVDQIDGETKALVLDADDIDLADDDFTPLVVFERGFHEFISIQLLQDVVSNLRQQKANASLDEQISAAIYYFEMDAFLTVSPE